MNKTVYSYNDDGYFVGATEAHESPLDPGAFLYPARTTDVAPPECDSDKIQQFVNGAWKLVDNYIGKEVWSKESGQKIVYDTLGPIPSSFTDVACPDAYLYFWKDGAWTLDEQKLLMKMTAERNFKLYSCDWTQLPDAPLTDEKRVEWKEYRQSLRDYTNEWTPDKELPKEPS